MAHFPLRFGGFAIPHVDRDTFQHFFLSSTRGSPHSVKGSKKVVELGCGIFLLNIVKQPMHSAKIEGKRNTER